MGLVILLFLFTGNAVAFENKPKIPKRRLTGALRDAEYLSPSGCAKGHFEFKYVNPISTNNKRCGVGAVLFIT